MQRYVSTYTKQGLFLLEHSGFGVSAIFDLSKEASPALALALAPKARGQEADGQARPQQGEADPDDGRLPPPRDSPEGDGHGRAPAADARKRAQVDPVPPGREVFQPELAARTRLRFGRPGGTRR